METDKLIAAAAEAAREAEIPPPADEKIVVHPQVYLNKLTRAGETVIAAKVLNAFRVRGMRGLHGTTEVEAAARHEGAKLKAAAWRKINEANATNYPLPAWVQGELGETY
jgi:hypothetical protein